MNRTAPCYVISLVSTPERLHKFKTNNPNFEFTVYGAVNGRDIIGTELDRHIEQGYQYSPGALGNCLSHQNLWRLAVNLDKCITVVEDDAIFHRDFLRLQEHLISTARPDWDFISWGWNFDSTLDLTLPGNLSDCVLHVDQNQLRKNYASYIQTPIEPTLFKLNQTFGTMAYSISPKGAAKLLEKTHPIKRQEIFVRGLKRVIPNVTLDITLNDHYSKMSCYAAFPPIVITENRHETSTVVEIEDHTLKT